MGGMKSQSGPKVPCPTKTLTSDSCHGTEANQSAESAATVDLMPGRCDIDRWYILLSFPCHSPLRL